jgi:uroporphyrinogen decarboxylase
MTPRERLKRTLNHKGPDRIAIDLGGAASSLNDEAYFKLKEYMGIQGDIKPFRSGTTTNYYDERILDALEIDLRRIILPKTDRFPAFCPDGSFYNEWGIRYAKKGEYYEIVENPLTHADGTQIMQHNWPEAINVFNPNGLREYAAQLYERTEYAIVARMPTWGLFDIACQLRGTEQFLIDMITDSKTACLLVENILSCQMEFYDMLLDQVGDYVQMVETCDDYGSQNALLFSPKLYRKIIKPYRIQLNNLIRKKAPGAKIFFHCCGAIFDLIPDLIESGVEVLNPIQPNAAGMDAGRLKKTYGSELCFHGGIDTQKALRGTGKDIAREVQEKIDILFQDGGYILAPANHIMSDVPPQNVITMYEMAKHYGKSEYKERL